MLGMGRALMTQPSLIVLDEPSAGLAPKITEAVLNQIRGLHEQGIGFIIIEQAAYGPLNIG